MDGQGDFDIDDLRGEIAMLRATVAGLRAAIDVIRAQRETATQRWIEAEQRVEQLEWLAKLSGEDR